MRAARGTAARRRQSNAGDDAADAVSHSDHHRRALTDIGRLLRRHLHRFPTQRQYADALGIEVGRLNRLMNGKGGGYSLSVLNCLRFAARCGEPPSVVLRAAQKGEIADLIESLYDPMGASITHRERDMLARLRWLTPQARHGLELMLHELPSGAIDRADEAVTARKDRRRTPSVKKD